MILKKLDIDLNLYREQYPPYEQKEIYEFLQAAQQDKFGLKEIIL